MKTLKSAILSSSLLLSIKSVSARTWPDVVDYALYQNVAVDTARVQLRIESDPFLETPHSSGLQNGLARDTSAPSASPTSAPCPEGSIHYQMNMYDTSGNGWQGTTIQVIGIEDQDTVETPISSTTDSLTYTTTTKLNTNEGNGYVSLSNTVQFGPGALLSNTQSRNVFPLGKVFESALTRGSSDHADICLVTRRCYDIVVHRGSTLEEVSWNLTAMVDNFEQEENAYIEGSAPMHCKFSIPDANGEVFCPTECSDEIPEKYTQNDATFLDLLHPPVETGNDGGFSAIYHHFAEKDELPKDEAMPKDKPAPKDEPAPNGKYSMFLAIGDKGEDQVETKPLKERPPPAPVFDVDSIGKHTPPAEDGGEDSTTEEGAEDLPVEIETQEDNQEEEGQGNETPEAPVEQEDQATTGNGEDQDIAPVVEDQSSPIETGTDEGESSSFGESGSFLPLSGGDAVVQIAQHPIVNEDADENLDDDDSLASLGLTEEDSNLPLTSEVRSAEDIQLIKDKTLVIPEYNGTMQQFQEEEIKIDRSESLPVDSATTPVHNSSAPVKTDTFHMLLRHGGKR